MAPVAAGSSDDEVRGRIAEVYGRGLWSLGWTYIYGQAASRRSPQIVTIGLSPGGGRTDAAWAEDAHLDQGHTPGIVNAYFDQPWAPNNAPTPLQQQFAVLRALNPHVPTTDWLSFQFIPFRSPGWAGLPDKPAAIALGEELLPWTLATARPRLIVAFGVTPVAERLLSFLKASLVETCATGWGSTKARVHHSPVYGRIGLLPHLSRYRVLGRDRFADEARLLRAAG